MLHDAEQRGGIKQCYFCEVTRCRDSGTRSGELPPSNLCVQTERFKPFLCQAHIQAIVCRWDSLEYSSDALWWISTSVAKPMVWSSRILVFRETSVRIPAMEWHFLSAGIATLIVLLPSHGYPQLRTFRIVWLLRRMKFLSFTFLKQVMLYYYYYLLLWWICWNIINTFSDGKSFLSQYFLPVTPKIIKMIYLFLIKSLSFQCQENK